MKIFLHWFLFFFCLEIACNKIVGGSGGSEKKKKKKKKKNPENCPSPARKIFKVGEKKKKNLLEIAWNAFWNKNGGKKKKKKKKKKLSKSRPEKFLRWGKKIFFCSKLPETRFRTKIGGLYFFSKMAAGGHLGSRNAPKNNRRWDLATIYAHTKYENNRFKFVTCRVHTRKCLRTRTRNADPIYPRLSSGGTINTTIKHYMSICVGFCMIVWVNELLLKHRPRVVSYCQPVSGALNNGALSNEHNEKLAI